MNKFSLHPHCSSVCFDDNANEYRDVHVSEKKNFIAIHSLFLDQITYKEIRYDKIVTRTKDPPPCDVAHDAEKCKIREKND